MQTGKIDVQARVCQKRLLGYGTDIPNPLDFHSSGVKLLGGSIGTGGCFLDCRYSTEKMISGIGAYRRLASMSTRIGIDDFAQE